MHGRYIGWEPPIEDVTTGERLVILSAIAQALDDLGRDPDPVNAVDPQGARAWLRSEGVLLLRAMGYSQYAEKLVRLLSRTPGPRRAQIAFWEEL